MMYWYAKRSNSQGKTFLTGPYISESRALEAAGATDAVELPTRNLSAATRYYKARLLHSSRDIDLATQRVGHTMMERTYA